MFYYKYLYNSKVSFSGLKPFEKRLKKINAYSNDQAEEALELRKKSLDRAIEKTIELRSSKNTNNSSSRDITQTHGIHAKTQWHDNFKKTLENFRSYIELFNKTKHRQLVEGYIPSFFQEIQIKYEKSDQKAFQEVINTIRLSWMLDLN